MKRSLFGLMLCLAVVSGSFALFWGETGARQESTPESGQTASSQQGYVKAPLPGGNLSGDNTLELTRLTLASGDSAGPYQHSGAAIYFVESGNLSVTISPNETAVVTAMTGDPTVIAPTVECASGCEIELTAAQWFAIDSAAEIMLESTGADPAVLLIPSLNTESEPAEIVTEMGTPVTVYWDSHVP